MAILRNDTVFERRLKNCPRAGSGVNDYIYHTLLCAAELGVEINEACERVRRATANCGREVPDREIDVQAERAYEWISVCPGTHRSKNSKWPSINKSLQERIFRRGQPERICSDAERWASRTPNEILGLLFLRDPLICYGYETYAFHTQRLSTCPDLSNCQYVIPNAMSKPTGITIDGKTSCHSSDNTGPRMYLIIEFDKPSLPDLSNQLLILDELAGRAPLSMIVYSGSDSYHGWFNCKRSTEDQVWNFMRYAVSLGADKKLWSRAQFVRVPNGFRPKTQKKQNVLYCDPSRFYD